MRLLGNVIWTLLYGFWAAAAHFLIGIIMCATLILIPFGIQHLKIARYVIWPFGKAVYIDFDRHPIMNILWVILGGAEIRDESIVAISKGKDMSDGMPMFFEVTAEEIHFAIRECIEEICRAITDVLEVTPPELVNDITDDGIFLCGGLASMYGLDKFIEKQTGIKVKIPGRETEIAALGALRTLVEEDYLSQNGYHFVTLEIME